MKSKIEVVAISWLLALSIAVMVFFNLAVLYGGSVEVTITKYNEMMLELLVLNFIVWPTISVGLHQWYSDE